MATTAPELVTVERAMSAEFPFCFPNTPLAQAARMMAQNKVARPLLESCPPTLAATDAVARLRESGAEALLVVREGQVLGVFGHRESVAAFGDGAQPVERFMRSPLPERSVDDSMEAGAEIMFREDTPYLMLTQDEGRLFRKTARPVGMVPAFEILEEIGRSTTDTASTQPFLGRPG